MCHSLNAVLFGVFLSTFVRISVAECGGKTVIYDSLNGTIILATGSDKYPANTHCEWLIKAPRPGQTILLTFSDFDTECSYDYLKVYDGSSSQKLLGAFSGSTVPPSLISNTSSIVLEFFSDNNYVRDGCVIDFVITDCPGNCSGYGSCINNKCNCDELYTGEACEIEICPQLCNNVTGNGQCSQSDGCQCNSDFIGESCSFSLLDDVDTGSWHLIRDNSPVFQNRFGHAGVYVEVDYSFWVFGGSSLNEVFDDLVKFNFNENNWQLVEPSGYRPAARYRHTLVTYKDTLVLFGGELANGTLLNDLWMFDISNSTWRHVVENNAGNPHALASHCAAVGDGKLIIFGGQTNDYEFSYHMYTYDLVVQSGWKAITYKLAKISDLRLVGHTCAFYPTLKSLIVFGGHKIVTGRQSTKRDTLLMYHMEGKVWLPVVASGPPQPTAYHSSVIIGDFMVTYGGLVHTHYKDETCYGDDIYLFNLKNFTWLSVLSTGRTRNGSWSNVRGRYSHVAAVFNRSTLLISGGFSGIANGDFLAYKIPSNIRGDLNKSTHMCRMFSQCVSCLTWGSRSDLLCGWCVQDSTCYPRSAPSGPCSSSQTTRGWWGDKGSFLTTVDQCRIEDKPPGLMSSIRFGNSLDDVYLVNPLEETFVTSPRRLNSSPKPYHINVKWCGFIYPFLSQLNSDTIPLTLRIGSLSASLHLSTDQLKENTEKVISFKSTTDEEILLSEDAKHPKGLRLFPNAAENKMYYIEVKTEFKETNNNPYLQVLRNYTLIDGRYVRPYYSDDCGNYLTCLECLSDVSCGWCSSSNACVLRNSSVKCHDSSTGKDIYLVLNTTYCETCAQYVDCESCSKNDLCIWRGVHEKMLYERCDRLQPRENKVKICASACASRKDCINCAMSTKCLWCEKQHKCIPWVSYPVAFMHGQCSNWSDLFTNAKVRCSSCNELNVCADCWKTRHCGWCGEFHNGSCFAGGYDAPYSGSCNQLIPYGTNNSHVWSYAECPDENECITRGNCHENADCFDTIGSYRCECRQGYEGNGTFCKALCNPRCVNGNCIKHESNESLDKCDCDLGWTGPVCSLDCGCYNHSTCHTGTGICDHCQDLTYGKKCEFCVRGSYGSATTSAGCKKCKCNGHGDEKRGICDDKTGHCFCMNNTMGTHCDRCLPGFSGHPERGEGCYYPCKAFFILSNMTQGTISSLSEVGQDHDANNVNCVWIITTLTNKSDQIVYPSELSRGTISFRMKDIALDCQTDHVYVYDGIPNKRVDLVGFESSLNLIGSLCGSDASNVPVIETSTGILVVAFKGNVGQNSRSSGFNASFVVNQCPNMCTGNRYCRSNGTHESCVCKSGWTGSACDHVICPANCSEGLSQGLCDDNSGKCICESGYVGPSCNIQHPFDDFIWEYSSDVSGSTSALARMGHSLVADVQTESLIIYGGYSLHLGILGDVWTFDTKTNNYIQYHSWGTMPRPRYFHAADVYKRTMYITGGITKRGYSSEVWKYNLDTKQWQTAENLPREMAGHTVNVINNNMYLIGGYSPSKHCSSKVYILKLDVISSPWSELNPSGGIFDACFGHTTVYDNLTNSLVVFGKKAMKMKPTLAILKLTTKEWVVIPVVPKAFLRYFHVSMIVGDVMIVTTGYTGNDVQDFADQPFIYDLRCGRWHKARLKGEPPSFLAHSAIASINGIAYVFGGYNGVSSDKLFRQNISSNWCSVFTTEISCKSVRRCVWGKDATTKLAACYVSDSHSHVNGIVNGYGDNCENGAFAMPIASHMTSWNDVCMGNNVPVGCSSCLQVNTSSTCSWSVDSQLCFSINFQPIVCAFGICGRVLRHYDVCPKSCNKSSYCYDCLEQYNCGWCTDETQNGNGVCTEGTLQGPYDGTCYSKIDNLATWVSSVCLPENECVNGHHDCDENEICVDLDSSYKCECLPGYERRNDSCTPVCNQGCVHGTCIDPDKCSCNFGWVSANCSIACQCHGKGHCVNEHQLDDCTYCQDYTTGTSCHRCLPGYVGQGGHCTSCNEECSGNAEVCYDPDEKNTTDGSLFGAKDHYLLKCECNDYSEGKYCENCKNGYFKSNQKCVKCKCRGHAASCDTKTGLDCKCQNKTRTPDSGGNTKQCSVCESPYLGSPDVEGQQCYRNLRILGHLPLAREHSKYLLPFQTSFYYIFPSYTNADIRLTIDISYGILDVYISYADNAFKVDPDQNVSIALTDVTYPECHSDGLNTYAKFSGRTQVVVFKGIKHRLVVTFLYDEHPMDKNKFYIVIKAGHSGANGILYFKQDSTKINLIVFFIVFASCFVFLLSAVTIGWSIKNHVNSRRDRIIQQVENERLHNRPCAKYPFLFEYQASAPSVIRHRKTTASTRKAIRPMSVQGTSDYHASVTTVIFQLPQTEKTKMSVSLGTTLALITPQQLDKLAQTSSKLHETTRV